MVRGVEMVPLSLCVYLQCKAAIVSESWSLESELCKDDRSSQTTSNGQWMEQDLDLLSHEIRGGYYAADGRH
jgi:hypothetical protein